MKFLIDAERMTFDDLIAMSEGALSERRNVMAKFLVDDAGNYLPAVEGRRLIVAVPVAQIKQVTDDFLRQFERVNPRNGAD